MAKLRQGSIIVEERPVWASIRNIRDGVMKDFSRLAVVLTIVALALPASATAFTSRDGTRVNPVKDGVYEVIPRTGGHGRSYWCAAGDYAQRALKAPWDARIYISGGLGVSETSKRRSAVQFTLQSDLAGAPGDGQFGSVNSLARGDSRRVRDAYNYCHQLPAGF